MRNMNGYFRPLIGLECWSCLILICGQFAYMEETVFSTAFVLTGHDTLLNK
jgi:hypothetical protein